MVIGDFDVMRAVLLPCETDAVLVVDPDRMLPRAIALERLQPVAGRCAQVVKYMGRVQHPQFAQGHTLEVHEAAHPLAAGEGLGVPVRKAADHM